MEWVMRALLPSFVRPYRPGDELRIDPPHLAENPEPFMGFLGWAERIHRYQVLGLEHVPSEGAALVVSPHPFMATGMFLLSKRIFERDGRLLRGLTDHWIFSIPLVRDLFATMGIVDGTQENGLRLLRSGQLATCMPGGGLDWSRSSRQRRQLRWGNHRGYARLAAIAGVPVIPTACPAGDELYWVLNDGWRAGVLLQRLLGTRRILPLPLVVGLGPLPFPVKLTQYVAPPIWPKGEGSVEDRARDLDRRVRSVLEGLLQKP
ncbi:lysophospholipid acyltransferase family protein [Planctomycetota bacterium]